ncbi:ubiquitin C-terminal hydrolase, putative [Talaromyces stipitatus ATCC 10500]|uniref:Ubiquitin carboxyl-terminal hydrolase n=1 Tax=Talaromyces stipitatus (strain ATCC 10500 / CBS 375.48 / QM 6759 / NRRL 1006) TaxID=441959 RepID=B8ML92_TALSN|nr:ubiquitin C-terminal hydrolase, putative [Talaromyces stipitatus ATCC 10500]EED15007.1 ubiquitin C-terminal hydrolase, putative [Talaromyces stipitatus ATCC 10500]
MPHGQPPIPPHSRRQHELHYSPGPSNMRSPPAYMNYHPPPVNGHIPPVYAPHYPPPWYNGYPQMHPPPPGVPMPPGPPPPRPYQQPPYVHGPLIVSSYPHSQPVPAPMHVPSNVFPRPPSAVSTPIPPTMSPPPISEQQMLIDGHERPPSSVQSVLSTPSAVTSSPAPVAELPKGGLLPRVPFRAPLPWLSVPEQPFPRRAPHKRRTGRSLQASTISVELPIKETYKKDSAHVDEKQTSTQGDSVSEPQTPTTSQAPSESDSTHPTTPSSTAPGHLASRSRDQTQTPKQTIVPVVPILPQAPVTPKQTVPTEDHQQKDSSEVTGKAGNPESSEQPTITAPAAPKSWADLVRSKTSRAAVTTPAAISENGSLQAPRSESLGDVLTSLGPNVHKFGEKIAFLEPRGLVNTGNMCYMNSVLQILAFCVPFYQFLDHIGHRATHSFKSDVPLIDATIMFMREFRVIDAAKSEDQLRMRLKHKELEEYGDAFIPEYVYDVIRQLPRFRDMRRGHQQDAQEFLGFFLEELHEECAHALQSGAPQSSAAPSENSSEADGWLEVGHKQKSAITRSSGDVEFESPITKIFGGKIRSEFKVPGNKNSVTLEPYQPLQLDIGSPEVSNIIDALKGLTKPETIHGDFSSPRGPKVAATKQVFIETLPPVLILHLKRFQYDSVTHGTQKIWKKVGYPLELEIPREVFPPHRRNAMAVHGGLPHYRLIGVIYHHGKNASGGHYTVDVRRQDGREWIRMDDTVIRRVRSEDVAEAGSEEDPKVLASALEQHKRDNNPNLYEQIDQSNQVNDESGWSQVNGPGPNGHTSKKSASGVVNGISSPAASNSPGTRTPIGRYGTRDNKVAYLLFYQRISLP